ncbi:hypothetical protein D3C76_1285100 [compost metagenome]
MFAGGGLLLFHLFSGLQRVPLSLQQQLPDLVLHAVLLSDLIEYLEAQLVYLLTLQRMKHILRQVAGYILDIIGPVRRNSLPANPSADK